MKITLHFKTPDVADYALTDAFGEEPEVVETEEQEKREEERAKAKEAIEKFVKYDENVSIEIDTETGTATVVEQAKRG